MNFNKNLQCKKKKVRLGVRDGNTEGEAKSTERRDVVIGFRIGKCLIEVVLHGSQQNREINGSLAHSRRQRGRHVAPHGHVQGQMLEPELVAESLGGVIVRPKAAVGGR